MAEITASDIRDECCTNLSDSMIDRIICVVNESIGTCLTAYPECKAELLTILAVCHFASAHSGGEIKSEKAPNGSTVTYETSGDKDKSSAIGFSSTDFGRQFLELDNLNCGAGLVDSSSNFMVDSSGKTSPSCNPESEYFVI